MKRFVFLGTALTLIVMLMFSCNKNRFELDHLESAQGSGQWKLPIGSMHVSTMDVLNQLGENNLISQDAAGNLLIRYSFPMENLIEGYTMLNLGTFNSSATFTFDKPEWEKSIIDTAYRYKEGKLTVLYRISKNQGRYLDSNLSGQPYQYACWCLDFFAQHHHG